VKESAGRGPLPGLDVPNMMILHHTQFLSELCVYYVTVQIGVTA
jgi:hypothetical protein